MFVPTYIYICYRKKIRSYTQQYSSSSLKSYTYSVEICISFVCVCFKHTKIQLKKIKLCNIQRSTRRKWEKPTLHHQRNNSINNTVIDCLFFSLSAETLNIYTIPKWLYIYKAIAERYIYYFGIRATSLTISLNYTTTCYNANGSNIILICIMCMFSPLPLRCHHHFLRWGWVAGWSIFV